MKNLIFIPLWMNFLISFESGQTREELSIKSKATVNHGFRIVNELIRLKIFEKGKKEGRRVPIELTEKGKELKKIIINLKEKFK